MRPVARRARISLGETKLRFAQQEGHCFWCLLPLAKDYHVDHVIPVALGGDHRFENTVLSHKACNVSKGAKPPWKLLAKDEWESAYRTLNRWTEGDFGRYLQAWQSAPKPEVKSSPSASQVPASNRGKERDAEYFMAQIERMDRMLAGDEHLQFMGQFLAAAVESVRQEQPEMWEAFAAQWSIEAGFQEMRRALIDGKDQWIDEVLYSDVDTEHYALLALPTLCRLWDELTQGKRPAEAMRVPIVFTTETGRTIGLDELLADLRPHSRSKKNRPDA